MCANAGARSVGTIGPSGVEGLPPSVSRRKSVPPVRIADAASAAGIDDAIASLPRGWDSLLSSQYDGGADLSGGEWQKLGLARALFKVSHGAGVLVLDEPAAHLDARAEARLYERFLDLTCGVTTIVISHRFSTVRQADRIVVLGDGRIVEAGTHDELLALDGEYAHMFTLQAARFADGPDEDAAAVVKR